MDRQNRGQELNCLASFVTATPWCDVILATKRGILHVRIHIYMNAEGLFFFSPLRSAQLEFLLASARAGNFIPNCQQVSETEAAGARALGDFCSDLINLQINHMRLLLWTPSEG